MSMRLIFSARSSSSSHGARCDGDPSEKSKGRGRSMFRMSPDTVLPLKTGAGVVNDLVHAGVAVGEPLDEEEGTIEVDLRCCVKGALLVSSVLFVFLCGALFATTQEVGLATGGSSQRIIELQPKSTLQPLQAGRQQPAAQPTRQPPPAQQPRPNQDYTPSSTRNTTLDTESAATASESQPTAPTASSVSSAAPVEYILVEYSVLQDRAGAIGSIDQCVRLLLQTTAFRVAELLLEDEQFLIRQDANAGQSSDLLLELLSERSTVQKLQACARIMLTGTPMFIYR